jgi:hypothetical protein
LKNNPLPDIKGGPERTKKEKRAAKRKKRIAARLKKKAWRKQTREERRKKRRGIVDKPVSTKPIPKPGPQGPFKPRPPMTIPGRPTKPKPGGSTRPKFHYNCNGKTSACRSGPDPNAKKGTPTTSGGLQASVDARKKRPGFESTSRKFKGGRLAALLRQRRQGGTKK